MFGIGMPEMIVIIVVALVVLGPKRLPEVARALGKGLAEFRKITGDVNRELDAARSMIEAEAREHEAARRRLERETRHKAGTKTAAAAAVPAAPATVAAEGEAPATAEDDASHPTPGTSAGDAAEPAEAAAATAPQDAPQDDGGRKA